MGFVGDVWDGVVWKWEEDGDVGMIVFLCFFWWREWGCVNTFFLFLF